MLTKMFRLMLTCSVLLLTTTLYAQDDDVLQVVATTSIIADVARQVGGDLVEVTSLIPPEADVHGHSPSPAEVISIVEADVVLVNGGLLEESLLDIVLENASVTPIAVSAGLEMLPFDAEDDEHTIGILADSAECDLLESGDDEHGDEEHHDDEHGDDEHGDDEHDHEHGECDPHVWMSVPNVILWVENIQNALITADPDNATVYEENAYAYWQQLDALEASIRTQVETLPEASRVLVTNHEFLAYFAHEYGFEVVGTVLPAASTLAEADPRSIIDLVEIINDTGVYAIFAEVSASSEVAQTVANEVGRDVALVTLYSGSLSAEDGPAATYIDYMQYNVGQIITALLGN